MTSFPREFVTELFLGGKWVDLSTRVHQKSGVVITRAANGEQALAAPSSSKFTFYDPNDELNPDNPVGPYFGLLTQNTPVRQLVMVQRDEFDVVVFNSWGSTPGGFAYSQIGGVAGDFSVTGGQARHLISSTVSFRVSYLPGLPMRNGRVQVTYLTGNVDVAGGPIEPANILLRGSGTDTYYMIRCSVSTADTVSLAIHSVVAGVETVLAGPVTVAGISHVTHPDFTVAAEIEDQTIRCKAFRDSVGEGFGWHLIVHDQLGRIPNAGWSGVRSGVGGGNTNIPYTFRYERLSIGKPRFQGQAYKLGPRSDVSHRLKFVAAEAGGAIRAFGRPEGAVRLDSAGRRHVPTLPAVRALWSLEKEFTAEAKEAPEYTTGSPSSITMRFQRELGFNPPRGEIRWGADTTLPSVARAPQLTNGGRLIAEFPSGLTGGGSPTGWGVGWGMRASIDAGAQLIFDTSTAGQGIAATFFTDGNAEFYRNPGSVLLFSLPYDPGALGEWHHYVLDIVHSGSDTQVFVYVDGGDTYVAAAVITGTLLAPLIRATFVAPNSTTGPLSLSQVVVAAGGDFSLQPGPPDAFYGWPGELAANRLGRLCGEEGVPSIVTGPGTSEPMGPQRPDLTLLQHLRECEAVEAGGMLFEPMSEGVQLRLRRSVYNQVARVVLDYAGDQVTPELQPSRDDRMIVNDVTVERIGGGQFRHEVTTGPLGTAPADQGGSGTYSQSPKLSLRSDTQLPDQATWRTHLGTAPDVRFPKVTVNLRAVGMTPAQQLAALDVNVMDKLTIRNLQARKVFKDLEQVVRGYTEVWGTTFEHAITFNTAPENPYHVFVLDAGNRVESDGTFLDEALTTSDTLWDISIPTGPLWTTTPAEFPFDVVVGGERCTCTAITTLGATTQRMTCTRNVNNLPGGKTHAIGAPIELADPVYLAM